MSEEIPDAPSGIVRFSAALDAYPARFRGNPLNLLFLHNALPIRHSRQYLRALDGAHLQAEHREYLFASRAHWPFPSVTLAHRPDPWALSHALFTNFHAATVLLDTQADIAAILTQRARETQPDIVLLMIADGLSYYDVPDERAMRPCLVTGPTITGYGHQQVTGSPHIARRLFDLGYRDQVGLTYFDMQQNDLAADLFALFGSSHVLRMRDVESGCVWLVERKMIRGYVQVTAMGLDDLVHQQRDRPLRQAHREAVFDRFAQLITTLRAGGKRVLACLTADHGILWRDTLEAHPPVIVAEEHADTAHPRYLTHGVPRPYGRIVSTDQGARTLLSVPHLTRALRSNEWGAHGGISAWESLVPLIITEE